MKRRIDLSEYTLPVEKFERNEENQVVRKMVDEVFPIRNELYEMMRIPGLFKTTTEIVEAITVGRSIRDCKDDFIELDKEDWELLKRGLDKLVDREHDPAKGQIALGGPRYEELIFRVVKADEVS